MDFQVAREQLLIETKQKIAESVNEDILLIQALATVDDVTTQLNSLSKRLREWHAYTLPELSEKIADHEHFVSLVATRSYDDLLSEYVKGTAMGARISDDDYQVVITLANRIKELYVLKNNLLNYIEGKLQVYMPNVLAVAGTTIAARLLSGAGSLRKLAILPASTVQLLGAEKALFRHLRSRARSPKYGHIFNHQLIQKANPKIRGKVARALADTLSKCAKLDYFKGEFLGEQYLKDLDGRFS